MYKHKHMFYKHEALQYIRACSFSTHHIYLQALANAYTQTHAHTHTYCYVCITCNCKNALTQAKSNESGKQYHFVSYCAIQTKPLIADVYYIVASGKANEGGAVITRNQTAAVDTWVLPGTSSSTWFEGNPFCLLTVVWLDMGMRPFFSMEN